MDEGRRISYEALEVGTPVVDASNRQFGRVEKVLQIPEEDLFHGISVTTDAGIKFVGRDQIVDITTRQVKCALSGDQVISLPQPHGTTIIHPKYQLAQKSTLISRLKSLFKNPD
jgi:hypothetical protein